jgi:predicted AlkP superfamily pyrophosphatase or phosphodiesterase
MDPMKRRAPLSLAIVLLLALAMRAPAQTTRPVADVRQIVIISIDGLRPDVLLRAHSPNIRALMDSGTFTFWAQTIPAAITLPSHPSMLTGVSVEKHGISWNSDSPPAGSSTRPSYPTLFELAHRTGYTTAMAAGKSKFRVLSHPAGSLDWSYIPEPGHGSDNKTVTSYALAILREHRPHVLFIHLPDSDASGHGKGWGSPEQLASVESADTCVGQVVQALRELNLADSTVILVTADHGGSGREHGAGDPRSLYIPWIVSGPGIIRGQDLANTQRPLTVHTEDTFATACFFLGIAPGADVDGKPVRQILQPAPTAATVH